MEFFTIKDDTNKYNIIHYCINSYDNNSYGGVARYDYHIKLIFPNRIFIKGDQEKNKLINVLKKIKNPIVITDNHLALDIPNKYPAIIVHHGSAITGVKRRPNWKGKLRDLCVNGQKKIFFYRKPENTCVISISTFVKDEFKKNIGVQYEKFENKLILHTSELNENRYKKTLIKNLLLR